MNKPEELSIAAQIDPGMRMAVLLSAEEELQSFSSNKLDIKQYVARGALALGLGFGGAAMADHFDAKTANAEGCLVDDGKGGSDWYDPCPGTEPAPQPTNPLAPRPTQPPSGGGGGGGTIPTATTIPYERRENDGDGIVNGDDNCVDVFNPDQANFDGDAYGDVCDSDADGDGYLNTGELADINDLSPGHGDAGLDALRDADIDVDSGSEQANINRLIGLMVNPADWDQTKANYAAYGVDVLSPTTTTTLAPTTTEQEATTMTDSTSSTNAPTSSVAADTTTLAPTTEQMDTETTEGVDSTAVPIEAISDNESDDDEDSLVGFVGGFAVGGAVLASGAIWMFVRRRNRDEEDSKTTGIGGSHPTPVAGI
jgi:hypothetical protein